MVVTILARTIGTPNYCLGGDIAGFVDFWGRSWMRKWWPLPDLNWGPNDYESCALTN